MMNDTGPYPGYVNADYLEALAAKLEPLKQCSYEFMCLSNGDCVLDLGCGPGIDTIPFGLAVGSEGKVVGIDCDEAMIHEANRKAREAGLSDWVSHKCADLTHLPYENGLYDAIHSERLLQHIADPEPVLIEMIRVTKPGGRIVIADTDYSSVSVDTSFLDTEWKLRRIRVDRLRNGYVGRQLYGLFRKHGLDVLEVRLFPVFVTDYEVGRYFSQTEFAEREAIESGSVTLEELDAYQRDLRMRSEQGCFFSYGTLVLIAGRKTGV